MILCKVISTFVRRGESYKPGDEIELEDERAVRMAEAKMVEYEGSDKKKPNKPAAASKAKKGKKAASPSEPATTSEASPNDSGEQPANESPIAGGDQTSNATVDAPTIDAPIA